MFLSVIGSFEGFLYSHFFIHIADEDAAVTSQSGVGGAMNGIDDFECERIFADDLNFDVFDIARRVCVREVAGTLAFTAAKTDHVGKAGALHAFDCMECMGDCFAFHCFDVCFDFFHRYL